MKVTERSAILEQLAVRVFFLYTILCWISIILLTVAAVAKMQLVSTRFGPLNLKPDFVFSPISSAYVLIAGGFFELITAIFLILRFRQSPYFSATSTFALAMTFMLYRTGLRWKGVTEPCKCFGVLGDTFLRGAGSVDDAAKLGIILLLLCSLFGLLANGLHSNRAG